METTKMRLRTILAGLCVTSGNLREKTYYCLRYIKHKLKSRELLMSGHVSLRYFLLTKANCSDNVKADYLSHEGQKDQKV